MLPREELLQALKLARDIEQFGFSEWSKIHSDIGAVRLDNGGYEEPDAILYGFTYASNLSQRYRMLWWDSWNERKLVLDWERSIEVKTIQNLCGWVVHETSLPEITARLWMVKDGNLWAMSYAQEWELVTQAKCREFHNAPSEFHTCGLYGTTSANTLSNLVVPRFTRFNIVRRQEFTLGLIRAWGRIVKAEHGIRAEYASPFVLIGKREVLGTLAPQWSEVTQITIEEALEAIQRGLTLDELLAHY